MANPVFIIDIGPDGVVATHPGRTELPVLIAPVPESRKSKDFNTIRPQLITIACKMLPGRHFAFDSSFIVPESARGFTKFARLMKALQEQDEAGRFPPCTVFGHADPVGDDAYNKILAGRRARAVYGLLTRQFKFWDELYHNAVGGDSWGTHSIRAMLSVSLRPGEPPYYDAPLDPGSDPQVKKKVDQDTADAIRAYKMARGSPSASPTLDDATREKLFLEYMDAICQDPDGHPFSLKSENFLAQGKGAFLKGDVQGCGDFNELFLLSSDEQAELEKAKEGRETRNALYKKNRRVVVYVFKHGTVIDPARWPCPPSSGPDGGPAGCKLRFWSDADRRRKRTRQRRTFGKNMDLFLRDADGNPVLDERGTPFVIPVEDTGNTMACRWYHAFSVHSPCERAMEEWIIRLRVDGFKKNATGKKVPIPLANRRFVVLAGESNYAAEIRGRTDANGELRIPVLDERTTMTLKLDAYDTLFAPPQPSPANGDTAGTLDTDKFDDEDQFMVLTLDAGALRKMTPDENDLASKQRLYNLGFGSNPPQKWTPDELSRAVDEFRKVHDAGKGGQLDDDLRGKIRLEHDIAGGPAAPPSDDDDSASPSPQPGVPQP